MHAYGVDEETLLFGDNSEEKYGYAFGKNDNEEDLFSQDDWKTICEAMSVNVLKNIRGNLNTYRASKGDAELTDALPYYEDALAQNIVQDIYKLHLLQKYADMTISEEFEDELVDDSVLSSWNNFYKFLFNMYCWPSYDMVREEVEAHDEIETIVDNYIRNEYVLADGTDVDVSFKYDSVRYKFDWKDKILRGTFDVDVSYIGLFNTVDVYVDDEGNEQLYDAIEEEEDSCEVSCKFLVDYSSGCIKDELEFMEVDLNEE